MASMLNGINISAADEATMKAWFEYKKYAKEHTCDKVNVLDFVAGYNMALANSNDLVVKAIETIQTQDLLLKAADDIMRMCESELRNSYNRAVTIEHQLEQIRDQAVAVLRAYDDMKLVAQARKTLIDAMRDKLERYEDEEDDRNA